MENKYLKVINAILGTNLYHDNIKHDTFLGKVSVYVLEKLIENNYLDEDNWYQVSFNPNLTLDFILKYHKNLDFYTLIIGEYIEDDIIKQLPSEIVLNSDLTESLIDEIDCWKEFEHIFDTYPNFIDWEYLIKNLEVDEEFITKYSKYLGGF